MTYFFSAAANSVGDTDINPAGQARAALRQLALVAWLGILLGFAMQGVILAGKIAAGAMPGEAKIIIDMVQGVTWSFFVCAGIGLGTTLAKGRKVIGGLVGMVSGPLAMAIAKGGQKVMASALGAVDSPAALSLLTVGTLRAVEYGILGWILASLAARSDVRARNYVASGGAVGLLFGGSITALTAIRSSAEGQALDPVRLTATGFNEIAFPIGCALVVFLASKATGLLSRVNDVKPAT